MGKGSCTMEPLVETEDVAKPFKKNIVEVLTEINNLEGNTGAEAVEVLVQTNNLEGNTEAGEEDAKPSPWEDVSLSPLPCEQPVHLALKRTKTEATRIHSKSDDKIDIRTIAVNKEFTVCTCQLDTSSDCECEGELVSGENLEDGAVVLGCPFFCDPLSRKTLKLVLEVHSWSLDKPNELVFKPSISTKGIVVEGEVKLEMKRAVTVVKGRKEMTMLWQLSFTDMRIGFTAAKYVKKGIKSPANLADVTCKLYEQVDEMPGMWSPRPTGDQEEVFDDLED